MRWFRSLKKGIRDMKGFIGAMTVVGLPLAVGVVCVMRGVVALTGGRIQLGNSDGFQGLGEMLGLSFICGIITTMVAVSVVVGVVCGLAF